MIKRFAAVLAVLALVLLGPGSVFAQYEEEENDDTERPVSRLNFSGGIDLVVVPLQVVTRDTLAYENNVWIGAGMGDNIQDAGLRTRLTLSADQEGPFGAFGFRTDLFFLYASNQPNLWDGHHTNAIDLQMGLGYVWWRPFDAFRVDVGRVLNGSQAGRIGNHWLSMWSVPMFGGGNIFAAHFDGGLGVLARYRFQQVEGLSAYVFVPSFGNPFQSDTHEFGWLHNGLFTPGGNRLNSDDPESNANRAFRVFQRTWLTVGYRTETYHARLQFIGANPQGRVNFSAGEGDDIDHRRPDQWRVLAIAPRVEAAFAFLGIENLVLDAGVKSWLPISDWITDTWVGSIDDPGYSRLQNTGTYWGGIGFGLGASYSGLLDGNLVLNARLDGDMLRRWRGQMVGADDPRLLDTVITNPVRLSFHVWPQFTFANNMQLTLSAGLNYVGRNTVDRDGTNLNEQDPQTNEHWERSHRLRFGCGISLMIPLSDRSSVAFGLAYRHGTADIHSGEARVVSIPVRFSFNW